MSAATQPLCETERQHRVEREGKHQRNKSKEHDKAQNQNKRNNAAISKCTHEHRITNGIVYHMLVDRHVMRVQFTCSSASLPKQQKKTLNQPIRSCCRGNSQLIHQIGSYSRAHAVGTYAISTAHRHLYEPSIKVGRFACARVCLCHSHRTQQQRSDTIKIDARWGGVELSKMTSENIYEMFPDIRRQIRKTTCLFTPCSPYLSIDYASIVDALVCR